MSRSLAAAVVTVSDRVAAGTARDTAGPAVVALCKDRLQLHVLGHSLVPDGEASVRSGLLRWLSHAPAPHLLLTVGGSGFGPRDHTPEATARLIQRPAPALLDLARQRSLPDVPHALGLLRDPQDPHPAPPPGPPAPPRPAAR